MLWIMFASKSATCRNCCASVMLPHLILDCVIFKVDSSDSLPWKLLRYPITKYKLTNKKIVIMFYYYDMCCCMVHGVPIVLILGAKFKFGRREWFLFWCLVRNSRNSARLTDFRPHLKSLACVPFSLWAQQRVTLYSNCILTIHVPIYPLPFTIFG